MVLKRMSIDKDILVNFGEKPCILVEKVEH